MKSFQKFVVLLVLIALVLSACTAPKAAETQSAVTEAAATEVAATEVAATEAAETIPVVVAVWVTDAPAVKKAAEAYEQETGKKVIVEEIAREVYREVETTALQSKTGQYDLLWMPSESVTGLVEGGFLEPLDALMANSALTQPDQADWASPGAIEAYKFKGVQYGFPVSTDTEFLFYRTDLIEKAPEDWDEYLAVAQAQTTDTRKGATIFGKMPESIAWDFINYFWSFGGVLIDENFQPQINSPEGVAALQYYVDLYQKYKVVPEGSPTYEYGEVLAAFQQDKTAMAIQWNGAYSDFASAEKSPAIADKFAATLLPGKRMEDGTINRAIIGHVFGFVMDANSKNKEAAWDFLVYLTGKNGLKYFVTDGASKNVNSVAVLSDPVMVKDHPEFPIVNDTLKYVQFWPNSSVTPDLILALAQEASSALAGTKTPQQAMDDANTAATKLMKDAGYIQ
jgi:ABC-type glycerol-3-phosphate transport system substrate-binding protein